MSEHKYCKTCEEIVQTNEHTKYCEKCGTILTEIKNINQYEIEEA